MKDVTYFLCFNDSQIEKDGFYREARERKGNFKGVKQGRKLPYICINSKKRERSAQFVGGSINGPSNRVRV